MKKTYVKPVMESEAFVANEYVAACWVIVCSHGESMVIFKEPIFEPNCTDADGDKNGDGFLNYRVSGDVYLNKINGKDPEDRNAWGIFGRNIHKLSAHFSGANGAAAAYRPNHPNASA